MSPVVQALFSGWDWRLEIVVVIVALGALYATGWARLRRRSRLDRLATRTRLAAYLAGLAILAASLMSPVDILGGQLFYMHMLQHMLTMMFAVPLLLLANPFPFMLWGMPTRVRRPVSGLFTRRSLVRRALTAATRPGIVFLAYFTVYLGWHDPALYNLALRRGWVHDIQHIMFFTVAVIFWWLVIGAAPRLHRLPMWARIGLLVGAVPPTMIAGVTIAFAGDVLYTYYETVPRIWGVTALQDQTLAGVIMWIPGSMMFILAALILVAGLLKGRDGQAPDALAGWDSDEAMIAPGLENRVVQKRWRDAQAVSGRPTNVA
jgi:cytochrome c oxidase assembly factor CtaG